MSTTPIETGQAQEGSIAVKKSASRPERSGTPAPGRLREVSRAWALAAVTIAMIGAAGIPIGYAVIRWTGEMAKAPGRFTGGPRALGGRSRDDPRISVDQIAAPIRSVICGRKTSWWCSPRRSPRTSPGRRGR